MTKWCRRREAASKTSLKAAMASGTSKNTELKLVGVAHASLEELLLDYPGLPAAARTAALG
jgi:hypothetical protein